MKALTLLILSLFVATAFAGCFGGSASDDFDYVPGQNWKPTGRTVEIRMWVDDIVDKEVYPGLLVNLWAFCAEAANAGDTYSEQAIEYPDEGKKCSVPGPQLRVTQGDRVIVHFENPHFHAHTIHWHGQHLAMAHDGAPGVSQDSVVEGGTYTYDFIAKRAGTLWYHCHVDGQVHVMMGLFGTIIVEPQDERWEPEQDNEYTLVFSTARRGHVESIPLRPGEVRDPHADHAHGGCGASGEPGCQNPTADVTPNVFMINGVSYPNTMDREDTLIQISAGEKVRLRLVNVGETFETFHTHGHDMLVTHKDGNPLPPSARYWVDTLPIGPAERYDVMLYGDRDAIGAWMAHTHVEAHITNDGQHPGGMHTMIVYREFDGDMHGFHAEEPGGKPYEFPDPPQDYRFDTTYFFGASANPLGDNNPRSIERELNIPIPADLCMLRSVFVSAGIHADSKSMAMTDLEVNIDDRGLGMRVPHVIALGGESAGGVWAPHIDEVATGPHTLTLSGDTLEATVSISITITYYQSEQLARDAGRPACGA